MFLSEPAKKQEEKVKNVDLLVTNGTVLAGDMKNGVKADILIEADKIKARQVPVADPRHLP